MIITGITKDGEKIAVNTDNVTVFHPTENGIRFGMVNGAPVEFYTNNENAFAKILNGLKRDGYYCINI